MLIYKKLIILLILITAIFAESIFAVNITVLPFVSKEESFEKDYAVKDGIARLLSEELKIFKRAEVSDYDFVIAYFSAEDIVEPYSVLSTNRERSISFTSNIFQSDYIVNGEVKDFSLQTNSQEYLASVNISINVIDVKTGTTLTNIEVKTEMKGLPEKKIYKTEDAYFSESILGKATKKVLNSLAKDIIEAVDSPSPKGVVTRIENEKIYINLGLNDSIKKGDIFEIFKIEKTLILPEENTNGVNIIITNTFNSTNTHIIENTNDTNIIANYEPPQKAGYSEIRTNSKGDLWYTSEKLYKNRFYRDVETYIGDAKVVQIFNNYAVIENINTEIKPELLMKVKLKK